MAKDGLTELAKLFKARDPMHIPSVTTGIVISPLSMYPTPSLRVQLNDVVVLNQTNIIIAAHLKDHYGEIDPVTGSFNALKEGDEVILIPVMDEQLYFLIDKVLK